MAAAMLIVAALPMGCGPEPLDEVSGTPSRSPVPVSPTPTAAATPLPVRNVVVALIDRLGGPIDGAQVTATIGSTVLDTSLSDENGFVTIDVVTGGRITAYLDGPMRIPSSHSIEVVQEHKSPVIFRMGSVFPLPTASDATARIVVEGLDPLEEIHLQPSRTVQYYPYQNCNSSVATAASNGTAVVDLVIPGHCLRNDGTTAVTVHSDSMGFDKPQWGVAPEVADGTASIVTLGTSSTPVVAQIQPTTEIVWMEAHAGLSRRRMNLGIYDVKLFFPDQDGTYSALLKPAGIAFADRFESLMKFSDGVSVQAQVLRTSGPTDITIDPLDGLPFVSDVAISTTGGHVTLSGTLNAGPAAADELAISLTWYTAQFAALPSNIHTHTAQFPLPEAGTFELRFDFETAGVPPPLEGDIFETSFLVIDSPDVDGFSETWRLHAWDPPLPALERRSMSGFHSPGVQSSLFDFTWW